MNKKKLKQLRRDYADRTVWLRDVALCLYESKDSYDSYNTYRAMLKRYVQALDDIVGEIEREEKA